MGSYLAAITRRQPGSILGSVSLGRFAKGGGVVWIVIAVLFIYTAVAEPRFRTEANLSSLSRQAVVLSLVALAQYLVVLGEGIDLSVGSVVKLTSILAAVIMDGSDSNLVLGILAAVGVGAVCGAVNGVLIAYVRIAPFIATLGTLALIRGVALTITAIPAGRTSPWLVDFYGRKIGWFFHAVLLTITLWIVAGIIVRYTRAGRQLVATGDNEQVARLGGVRIRLVRLIVYTVAGVLSAVAGLMTVARSGVGDPNAGFGLEFEALAAVVIGGISLAGGRGSLIGALGGAVLFAMIGNTFNILGVEVWYQQLLKGLIILLAASLYIGSRRSQHEPN